MANPQVLIVGAGPIGLTLALGLHQGGVRNILVADQHLSRDEPNNAKALSISASSLEVFRTLGIAEDFIAAGIPSHKTHFGGGPRLLDLGYEVLGTKYPFNYMVPQWKTEQILLRRCEEVGIVFAWGRRFVSLESGVEGDTVVAVFENLHASDSSPGESVRIQVPWLIGCDSTRSAVRRALDISWEGNEATHFVWVADCTIDDDTPRMITGIQDGATALLVTTSPGRARAGAPFPPSEIPANGHPAAPDEMYIRAWATRYWKQDYGIRDITWSAAIGDGQHVAGALRRGRVFLAGDAAHQLFFSGGQGMNTGFLDATNLAWKLALVVTGRIKDTAAVERVLDSYARERLPAIQAVVKNVHAQVAIFSARSEKERAAAELIAEAFEEPAFNRLYARRVAGFGDPTEPYRSDACGTQTVDALVGTRLTHISDAHESALLQAANENTFILAALGSGDAESVKGLTLPSKHQGQYKTLEVALEPDGEKWMGVKAILLRPDLRVAWVLREGSDGADWDMGTVSNILSWWFGELGSA